MDQSERSFITWMKSAKVDLRDFRNNLEINENYRCLYFLQQASEKSAKAILFGIGLASEQSKADPFSSIGIKMRTPVEYGHIWRYNFIRQMESLNENPLLSHMVPLLREKGLKNPQTVIHNAKMVEDIRGPTIADVSDTIALCNSLLDQAQSEQFNQDTEQKLNTLKPMIENVIETGKNAKSLDEIMKVIPSLFEGVLSQRNTNRVKDYVNQLSRIVVSKSGDRFSKGDLKIDLLLQEVYLLTKRVFPLGALLILSMLLTPCETYRYPSHENIDGFIPNLAKIQEVIERCILTSFSDDKTKTGEESH